MNQDTTDDVRDGERAIAAGVSAADAPPQVRSILVVDDNPVIRDALETILTDAGYEVLVAGDGKTAISLCAGRRPDLVITDLIMPGMEGIETIQHFKKALPGIRIIAMSGADRTFLQAARLLGAQAVLPKPIRSAALLETVRSLIG